MKQEREIWLTCYIYDVDDLQGSLLEKIWSVTQEILKKKLASQFFFIRYFDPKGQHIRLRFKGERKIIAHTLKSLIKASFAEYQVRFTRYIPEMQRYGGQAGVTIAEEQFELSSKTILTILTENHEWNYERALGTALQLHLGMAHSIGMNKKQTIFFFDHIASHAKKHSFENVFSKQKNILIPRLKLLWDGCEQHTLFRELWFNTWLQEMSKIKTKLTNAKRKKSLDLANHSPHQNPLWSFYESYVHMTNNRLGIATLDESYIAYIIKKSMETT